MFELVTKEDENTLTTNDTAAKARAVDMCGKEFIIASRPVMTPLHASKILIESARKVPGVGNVRSRAC
jgi:hypothetical protein